MDEGLRGKLQAKRWLQQPSPETLRDGLHAVRS